MGLSYSIYIERETLLRERTTEAWRPYSKAVTNGRIGKERLEVDHGDLAKTGT
jgi:hypothetical protein